MKNEKWQVEEERKHMAVSEPDAMMQQESAVWMDEI